MIPVMAVSSIARSRQSAETCLSGLKMNLDVKLSSACACGDPAINGLSVEPWSELETAKEKVVSHVTAILSWN